MSTPERFTDDDSREAWNGGAEARDHFVESGAEHYRRAGMGARRERDDLGRGLPHREPRRPGRRRSR